MDPIQGVAGRDLLSSLHLPPMVTLQTVASFALFSVVDFSSERKLNCPRQTHKASLLNVRRDLRYLFTPHSWHLLLSVWLHIPTQITASSLCLFAEQELGNALAHECSSSQSHLLQSLIDTGSIMLLSHCISSQIRASPASCSDSLLLTM